MQVTGDKEPFLDFMRDLCVDMMSEHGSAPLRRITHVATSSEQERFDGQGHWIVGTELDASGKNKRRNCRYCALQKKADMKTVFFCEKCKVPLHTHCFKGRIFDIPVVHVEIIVAFQFQRRKEGKEKWVEGEGRGEGEGGRKEGRKREAGGKRKRKRSLYFPLFSSSLPPPSSFLPSFIPLSLGIPSSLSVPTFFLPLPFSRHFILSILCSIKGGVQISIYRLIYIILFYFVLTTKS
jgi:hypothetical protein